MHLKLSICPGHAPPTRIQPNEPRHRLLPPKNHAVSRPLRVHFMRQQPGDTTIAGTRNPEHPRSTPAIMCAFTDAATKSVACSTRFAHRKCFALFLLFRPVSAFAGGVVLAVQAALSRSVRNVAASWDSCSCQRLALECVAGATAHGQSSRSEGIVRAARGQRSFRNVFNTHSQEMSRAGSPNVFSPLYVMYRKPSSSLHWS